MIYNMKKERKAMGMWKPSSCGCSSSSALDSPTKTVYQKRTNWKPPNPNPAKFEVKRIKFVNNFTILLVKYPDCTNFEGLKILVMKGAMSLEELANIKTLDPHFCEHNPNLIARFRPGCFEDALKFCECLE